MEETDQKTFENDNFLKDDDDKVIQEADNNRPVLNLEENLMSDVLWNILPPNGEYIRYFLEFAGFQTKDAILTLEKHSEMESAINFVKNNHDLIDESQKKNVLGIFEKNPEKFCILPGLKSVMKNLFDAIREDIESSQIANRPYKRRERAEVASKRSEVLIKNFTIKECAETLHQKMMRWLLKQSNVTTYSQKMNFDLWYAYSITDKRDNNFSFTCNACHETISLTKRDNTVILSNAQRHVKSCWFKEEKIPILLNRSRNKPEPFHLHTPTDNHIGSVPRVVGDEANSIVSDKQPTNMEISTENIPYSFVSRNMYYTPTSNTTSEM